MRDMKVQSNDVYLKSGQYFDYHEEEDDIIHLIYVLFFSFFLFFFSLAHFQSDAIKDNYRIHVSSILLSML